MCLLLQVEDLQDDPSHRTCRQKLMDFFRPVGRDVALRKGPANQVGNITECALLGFMLDLGMALGNFALECFLLSK